MWVCDLVMSRSVFQEKPMKKLIAIVLAAAIVLSLAATMTGCN